MDGESLGRLMTETSLSAGGGGAAGVLGPGEEQLLHGPEPGELSPQEGSRASLSGHPVHMAGPPPLYPPPPRSVLLQESPGAPSASCPPSLLVHHPSHSGAVLPLKLPSLGRGARNFDIPAAANLIFLPLNNWLVQCREHLVMSGGSGLESGPELALGPGVGSGEARGRRAGGIGKAVGRVLGRAEPPRGRSLGAARVPGGRAGHGNAVLPPPAHGPNSSSEWNVAHKRQARPALGASLPHHRTRGSAEHSSHAPSPAGHSFPRLGGLTSSVHVCAQGL